MTVFLQRQQWDRVVEFLVWKRVPSSLSFFDDGGVASQMVFALEKSGTVSSYGRRGGRGCRLRGCWQAGLVVLRAVPGACDEAGASSRVT